MIDCGWVTPTLACGACFQPDEAPLIVERLAVRHIVDLRDQRPDAQALGRHGIFVLHLPTQDLCAVPQEMLARGVAWVRAQLAEGRKVLVHCEYGVGRSALLTCCILVGEGHDPLAAMARLKEARPRAAPNPEQLEAFIAFSAAWAAAHPVRWQPPRIDELADIAYRHLRLPARPRA